MPNISSFISAVPGKTEGIEHADGQFPLIKHSHEKCLMYFNGSKTFSADISVGINEKAGNGGLLHLAETPGRYTGWPKKYTASVVLSASSARVLEGDVGESEKSLAAGSYPSHDMLPVMIYIGKNGNSDGGGQGGGDDSKYTKIFSDSGKVW